MAWTNCPYCTKKVNGAENLRRHKLNNHQKEYAGEMARDSLVWKEERLTQCLKDKEQLLALHKAIGQNIVEACLMRYLTYPYERLLQEYTERSEAWRDALQRNGYRHDEARRAVPPALNTALAGVNQRINDVQEELASAHQKLAALEAAKAGATTQPVAAS